MMKYLSLFVGMLLCGSTYSMDSKMLFEAVDLHQEMDSGKAPINSENVGKFSFAFGYYSGVFYSLLSDKEICPGKGVTPNTTIKAMADGIREVPEAWNMEASIILNKYLKEVFPCK